VDLEVFDTGLDRYEHGFDESLDLLLDCLTQPRTAASGKHFTFPEATVVPRSHTCPHPPVVVACTSTATVGLAAARRDPHAYTDLLCALHPVDSPDDCVDRIRAGADRTGIGHVILMVEGGGDHDTTLATIARFGEEVLPRLGE
jgi:alkanesulfonate monooxygenase SsuD/methylene tetrahydromethanopterin reductase-like flavin-dependent oxidoreductase (luciferase family)